MSSHPLTTTRPTNALQDRGELPLPRILIVDDDPEMIHLIREVLELLPSDILVRNDGSSALDLLRREVEDGNAIDVVLLDIMMPGEDGFHILERMKESLELQQIPVILITGLNSISAKTRGLQMGADDYIIKPFDPQELLARLGVVLRIRRSELMLRQRNEELAALDEINRTISSSLDLDEVLVSALRGLGHLIRADILAVVLNNEETQEHVVRAARCPMGLWLEGRLVPADDLGLTPEAEMTRPLLRRDVTSGFWNRVWDRPTLDLLCVPLAKNDETVGVLVAIGEPHSLREADITLVERVAATVVVAVEKAWLFHDLEAFADEIERSQTQLIQAEKMAAVGRLTASLAHEINNPLQAIQNSLHLASHKGLDGAKKQEFLEMAQSEVNRLIQIVHRMLDFYRPSSATHELNVNQPLEDALAIAQKRLQQSHIKVEARLSHNLPPVRGTANQLTQVFLNLVINAIEAMPEGGTLWVGTAHHTDAKQVVVAFRDSGPGIPADIRDHLFEPFHTTKPTGTGLGLAISYGIIERHAGTIEVESPQGGGTTFIIRLPEYFEPEDP
ncbi:MAG: response regulator [Anaerolineae bacterium]|nr:response regulator [Anaerolineae bacterium]